MSTSIDETHDPALTSWLASANETATDFPIQNLPFGRFRSKQSGGWRIGVAIGDHVLDLARAKLINTDSMNELMALPRSEHVRLRRAISAGLRSGSTKQAQFAETLVPMDGITLGVPCEIGGYTDFYTSIHHATTIGKQFRPENPLLPNYRWVPIGYHGRVSSIMASGPGTGHEFKRPLGQTKAPDASEPSVGASRRLDYELELGVFISRPNAIGDPIPITQAEEHVFGLALFNDWTARDIQPWEYQPLGPFLSKNFASTLSPWMVTLDAFAPFRAPFVRPQGDPAPLPYLDSAANRAQGALDIDLEVWLQTAQMRASGQTGDRLMTSNYRDAYWTLAQMVAHHTINGCNLRAGDLFGSGTLSGPEPEQAGSLLELTRGGTQPIRLSNGETRGYLEDGDTVILRGRCSRDGFRTIGFGECRGTVLPAPQLGDRT